MFIFDLGDIIAVLLMLIIILCFVINLIYNKIKRLGKKNCYKCKYYKLHDVASAGDCCWYKCIKKERIDNGCSFNNSEHYEKCKLFEEDK